VRADDDVAGGSHLVADGADDPLGGLGGLQGELQWHVLAEALVVRQHQRERVDLDRGEADVDVVTGSRGGMGRVEPHVTAERAVVTRTGISRSLAGRGIVVDIGVAADAVAHRAAEQLVHRLAAVLADDVPARHLDRAEDAELGQLRVVAVAGPAVHPVEEHLGVVRVVADDRLLDDVRHHRGEDRQPETGAEQHHLAVAARPGVCVEPNEKPAAPATERRRADNGEDLEAGDLHPIMMPPD
jgi:hypothetical protein